MSTAAQLAQVATRHDILVGQSLALVERVALDFARAQTLAYSAAHPRRRVVFCSAMGSMTLHVQKGGEAGRRTSRYGGSTEYMLGQGDFHDFPPPPFLRDLITALEKTDQTYFGPVRIICRGGKLLEEVTHWGADPGPQ